jgi:hypothetical protein
MPALIGLQLEGEIVQLMQRLPLSLPAEAVWAAIVAGALEARQWRERGLLAEPAHGEAPSSVNRSRR